MQQAVYLVNLYIRYLTIEYCYSNAVVICIYLSSLPRCKKVYGVYMHIYIYIYICI